MLAVVKNWKRLGTKIDGCFLRDYKKNGICLDYKNNVVMVMYNGVCGPFPNVLQYKATRTITRQRCQEKHGPRAPMIHADNVCTINPASKGGVHWIFVVALFYSYENIFSVYTVQVPARETPVVLWLIRKVLASVYFRGIWIVLVDTRMCTPNCGRLFHFSVKLRKTPFQIFLKANRISIIFCIILCGDWKICFDAISSMKKNK